MDLARHDWRLIGCLSKTLRDEDMHVFWTLAERVPNECLRWLILGNALRGTCDALQGLPRLRTSTEALQTRWAGLLAHHVRRLVGMQTRLGRIKRLARPGSTPMPAEARRGG
jgi:REP element-mobilizing transposase RayT